MEIEKIVEAQRAYFKTGATLPLAFRLASLHKLKEAIRHHEQAILDALTADLGKSGFEGYLSEVGIVLDEIRFMEKRLKHLIKPRSVPTPLGNFPGKSVIIPSPYGNVLIMSPWNYPFQLAMNPLVDALAAGNTAVIKPGSYSPATSAIIDQVVQEAFSPEYVTTVLGGRAENQALLDQKFDYIFFTGSKAVGREVQAKAAVHLTPITLELGGKSPTIVDATAHLPTAARRIAFGKYLNVGQTCVAPDYVLVHESVKEVFVDLLKKEIVRQFGENPLENKLYGHIINEKHFQRLTGLLAGAHILHGGQSDAATRKIAPTVVDGIDFEHPVMKEEIFGPILPILTFKDRREIPELVAKNPTPLAFYVFAEDKPFVSGLLRGISFGGGCVNDTVVHVASPFMAFGGVGESGMGGYHGVAGFETFTHRKSVVIRSRHLDVPIRYQPYTKRKEKLIRAVLK